MILKLGMKHQGEGLYKVYINQDPGMTTYFTARFNWARKWATRLKIYDSEQKWTPGAGLSLPEGNMHVYYYNIQRSFSLKLLG